MLARVQILPIQAFHHLTAHRGVLKHEAHHQHGRQSWACAYVHQDVHASTCPMRVVLERARLACTLSHDGHRGMQLALTWSGVSTMRQNSASTSSTLGSMSCCTLRRFCCALLLPCSQTCSSAQSMLKTLYSGPHQHDALQAHTREMDMRLLARSRTADDVNGVLLHGADSAAAVLRSLHTWSG